MSNQILPQQTFESLLHLDEKGEHWFARELQTPLGYKEWRKFEDSIERARAAIRNSGFDPSDHIGGADKMVQIGSGAQRFIADYRLTRYGAYLVAMNGDPRKPEIAAAQSYFAVRTREAEMRQPQSLTDRLAIGLDAYRELAEQRGQRVKELTPKADAWDDMASADGDRKIADAAKALSRSGDKIGERRLFSFLAEQRWIFRDKGDHRWRAYQRVIDQGWLSQRLNQPRTDIETGEKHNVPPTVMVTHAGLVKLRELLGIETPLMEVAA